MHIYNFWGRNLNAYSTHIVLHTTVSSTMFSFKLVQCPSWDQGGDWCLQTSHISPLAPHHFVELWAVWAIVLEILHSLLDLGHAPQVLLQPACRAVKEKSCVTPGRWKMKMKDHENGVWKRRELTQGTPGSDTFKPSRLKSSVTGPRGVSNVSLQP